MKGCLKQNDVKIKDGIDMNATMRDMMSVILEGVLNEELDEELGYSKYDYRNKETGNSRYGYSQTAKHTSYGDMEFDILRNRNGEFELQVIKNYQSTVTQDIEEQNRGVNDILIARMDGLVGFPQAIEAVYPQTKIQQCIIHQIRHATRFVSHKEIKAPTE